MDVRYFAVAASLLLSLYSTLTNVIPNVDAFLYLRTAAIYLADGPVAALAYYPWASYSILIGVVHQLTGFNLLVCAQLVNGVLFAGMAWVFISLCREIDNSRRVTLFAAVCVLIYPQLNEYRPAVIRDIGFLTFALAGLLQLIRLNRTQRFRHGATFTLTLMLGALFRPEALFYLVAAPLGLLLSVHIPWRARLRLIAAAYGLTLLLGLIVLIVMTVMGFDPLDRVLSAFAVYQPFLEQARQIIEGGSPELRAALFHEHAANFSGQYITVFLLTGLLAIVLIKIFTGFGGAFLLVILVGLWRRLAFLPPHVKAPALAFLMIALGIMLSFVFVTRFMSTRYTMLFCIVLVVLVPVIVDRAARLAQEADRQRTFNRVAGFLVLYAVVDAYVTFGRTRDYQQEVAQWVRETTPATMPLVTNVHYIAWYSGLVPEYDRTDIAPDAEYLTGAAPGSRLVILLNRGNGETLQHLEQTGIVALERYFPGAGDPRIGVYRRL